MLPACVLLTACLLAAIAPAQAQSETPAAAPAAQPAVSSLSITVVTSELEVPTLEQRVSSWFRDGTRVSIHVASQLPSDRIFAAGPGEVRVWVVRLSPERAVVVFSTAQGPESARYLLREVRLVSGLDELGLERLASVIHAAFVALREGVEGSARTQVERELVEAGLLPAQSPLAEEKAQALAAPPPSVSGSPVVADSPAAAERARPMSSKVLLAAGYGVRLRGVERLGHGPLLSAGLQTASALGVLDAQVSSHLLVGSDFSAGAFSASLQTSAFRAQIGLEPSLSERVTLQALVGAGADWARISSQISAPASADQVSARAPGSQWRGAVEFTLGFWWKNRVLHLGAAAHANLLYGGVHYSVESEGVERRLVAPWPVQPGLSLQARFQSSP